MRTLKVIYLFNLLTRGYISPYNYHSFKLINKAGDMNNTTLSYKERLKIAINAPSIQSEQSKVLANKPVNKTAQLWANRIYSR